MPVSNHTLMKIAGIGGFITAGTGYALHFILNHQIAQTEYYKEAISIFTQHRSVVYMLGKPIKVGAIDVSDRENNWTGPLTAHYMVPVKGPKQRAFLYFWANRKSEKDSWSVHRMELQVKNEPNKRFLIKNEPM